MRVVWSILVCLCLVGCMNPKNKAIGVYDTSQLPSDFGGGEAYVSVADGIFVQSGMVNAGDFYNKIVGNE